MNKLIVIFVSLVLVASISWGSDFQYAPAGIPGKIPVPNEINKPPSMQTDDWQLMDSIWVDIAGPTGLTYDGSSFWITNYTSSANSCVYEIDPATGQTIGFIPSPDWWPCGITWDGTNLWIHDYVVGHAQVGVRMSMCKVDPATGNVLDILDSQYTSFSGGLAWDGQYLYYGVRPATFPGPCYIYRLDPVTGNDELWIDLGADGGIYGLTYHDSHLWYSDPYNLTYYKITLSGALIDQSPAIGPEPAGMTFEGDLLCNVDNTSDQIYKMLVAPPELDVVLTPHDPPIMIGSGGGSFFFDVSIENTTSGALTADVWIEVIPPGGTAIPLIIRPSLTFPANTAVSRTDLEQSVPAGAPAGVYTYMCSVGEIFVSTTDYDQFTFEKEAEDVGVVPETGWTLSGWEGEAELIIESPSQFALRGAYPNPFNPSTVLSFQLSVFSKVNLSVYDVTGQKVAEVVNGWRDEGMHEVTFDASNLPSGVYFASLIAGNFQGTQKLLLVK